MVDSRVPRMERSLLTLTTTKDALELATWLSSRAEPPDKRELDAALMACSMIKQSQPASDELLTSLETVVTSPNPTPGLRMMLAAGSLQTVIPPVSDMIALSQESGRRHKDVWEHTLAVVEGVPPVTHIRLAALMHDIGKPATLRFVKGKGATFHNHPAVGARITDEIFKDLRVRRYDDVTWLVAHHLRPAEHSSEWTDSAIRRFIKECGDRAADLMSLSRADLTTRNPAKIRRARDNADALCSRMESVIESDSRPKLLMKGFGDWLMKRWGLSGREIGIVKRAIESQVEAGSLPIAADFCEYERATEEAIRNMKDSVAVCEC